MKESRRDRIYKQLQANPQLVYGEVKKQRRGSSGWWEGICPFHDEKDPSFGWNETHLGWKCQADTDCGKGDVFSFLMKLWDCDFKSCLNRLEEKLGSSPPPKPKAKKQTAKKKMPPISQELITKCMEELGNQPKIMAYLREKRGIISDTLRAFEIGFWKERSRVTLPVRNEKGRLVNIRLYSAKQKSRKMLHLTGYGSPARLYCLDKLAKDTRPQCFVCEGEMDCLLLNQHGFLAVTSTHGCTTFFAEWVEHFYGRNVVIIYDCDDKSHKAVEQVLKPRFYTALATGKIKSIKFVWLPLKGTPDSKDVTDYFLAGNTSEDLIRLINDTPSWIIEEKPQIITSNRQLRHILKDARAAMLRSNTNSSPELFTRDGNLVALKHSMDGRIPRIRFVDTSWIHNRLAECADWFAMGDSGPKNVEPRASIARCIGAVPPNAPELTTILSSPGFSKDGKLMAHSGYHKAQKLWMQLPVDMEDLKISETPTNEEIAKSREIMLEPFLDFPFSTISDRTHTMALTFLPFMRPMLPGPTPLHLVTAPTAGTGKTLLVKIIYLLATGKEPDATTLPEKEEETRKKLTALLAEGSSFVFIDNTQREAKGSPFISSSSLSAILTTEGWLDRILGVSKIVYVENNAIWTMTANNPVLSPELTRRSVPIRMVPLVERPSLRTGFKHDPVTSWVKENRYDLVKAILTLIQAWLVMGSPKSQAAFGSFESWAAMLGGICETFGFQGFLGNLDELYNKMDSETEELRSFVIEWWKEFGEDKVTATKLNKFCQVNQLLEDLRSGQSEHAEVIRLGKFLTKMAERVFDIEITKSVQVNVHLGRKRMFNLIPVVLKNGDTMQMFADVANVCAASVERGGAGFHSLQSAEPVNGHEKPRTDVYMSRGGDHDLTSIQEKRAQSTSGGQTPATSENICTGLPGKDLQGESEHLPTDQSSMKDAQCSYFLNWDSWKWAEKKVATDQDRLQVDGELWRRLNRETLEDLAETVKALPFDDDEKRKMERALERGWQLLGEKRV